MIDRSTAVTWVVKFNIEDTVNDPLASAAPSVLLCKYMIHEPTTLFERLNMFVACDWCWRSQVYLKSSCTTATSACEGERDLTATLQFADNPVKMHTDLYHPPFFYTWKLWCKQCLSGPVLSKKAEPPFLSFYHSRSFHKQLEPLSV